MLSRTSDASGTNTPRELIHLLQTTIKKQNERLERGQASLPGDQLFEGAAIKDALPEVSKTRLEQTIYAEYPQWKDAIQKLRGGKTAHTVDSLSHLWKCDLEKAEKTVQALHQIGLLNIRINLSTGQTNYWVPFLYRPALELVQGSAED